MGGAAVTPWRICVTFDVDLVDHVAGGADVDEMAAGIPPIREVLERHPHWRATWCLRLDDQIAASFGHPAALLDRHHRLVRDLRSGGDEIAWHPHAYTRQADHAWRQNIDEDAVAEELSRLAPLARARGMSAVRTGWGFHTNRTMKAVADAGLAVDSSAIPRPQYEWDATVKDWSTTPSTPFFPSIADYRIPGEPHLPIREVPISVGEVRAPYDTGRVVRYLNPAFHEALLAPAMDGWFVDHDYLVTVTHPYELLSREAGHGLIAFDLGTFERNLLRIEQAADRQGCGVSFVTLSHVEAGR